MLDQRTAALLQLINKKCDVGSYHVISVNDLIIDFPSRFGADEDVIRQCILNLSLLGYINLRYDRDGEFCLCPTAKGRLYCEESEPLKDEKRPINDLLPHIFGFLERFFATFLSIFLAFILLKALGVLC